ncbi:MAG: class I SAM-dependent methyltransferase [Acidobacteriota bacterium]
MSDEERDTATHGGDSSLDRFSGDNPTHDPEAWRWLWTGDHTPPIRSHRPGLSGRLTIAIKRLLRPLARLLVGDRFERQRVFNLILLDHFTSQRDQLATLHQHVLAVQETFRKAIEEHAEVLTGQSYKIVEGFDDAVRHNDALFARVDQKLDRYRRESRELWHQLGALIARAEAGAARASGEASERPVDPAVLASRLHEQTYQDLERRHRGTEAEIAGRISAYLPYLQELPGPVLDLGCGRGEALTVLAANGIEAFGIDSSKTAVELCREQGLDAIHTDLFAHLEACEPGSLGGVVSFHVVEHLPATSLEALVRLAWRALRPGGVLVIETPSPLSVVMAARNFWTDPTHIRPVHPASLEVVFRAAGFEPVHRIDIHPFPTDERLPEIALDTLPEAQRRLGEQINALRDALDDLLYGERDYGLIGTRG